MDDTHFKMTTIFTPEIIVHEIEDFISIYSFIKLWLFEWDLTNILLVTINKPFYITRRPKEKDYYIKYDFLFENVNHVMNIGK